MRQHLRALLAAHRPADALEARHLERLCVLLEVSGDPFSRDHFDPGHFTASAFVLSPDGTALLLIHHSKLHRWLQPGGHVDPTDVDILAAARREVAEEVGLTDLPHAFHPGPLDVDVHEIPALKADPAHAHFDVRFAFRAQTWAAVAGSDAAAARWVPLEAVNAMDSDASVLRAVAKIARLS